MTFGADGISNSCRSAVFDLHKKNGFCDQYNPVRGPIAGRVTASNFSNSYSKITARFNSVNAIKQSMGDQEYHQNPLFPVKNLYPIAASFKSKVTPFTPEILQAISFT
jgi:hypothetical protein